MGDRSLSAEQANEKRRKKTSAVRKDRRLGQTEKADYKGRGKLRCAICNKQLLLHESFNFCEARK